MTDHEPLLEVRGLAVRYRRRRTTVRAVDGIDLDVRRGETVGLVGESGSGKSTIGRAVLGLVPVHDGTIHFGGADITHLSFARRREHYRSLQIVFQDPYSSLNPSRTIGSILAEPLQAFGLGDKTAVRTRVEAMLERVGLPRGSAGRFPRQFSGGQRQRVAIARALMLSPQLIVLDEPTSALDLSVQAQILNLLRDLQHTLGLSYLFISHDLDVVRHLCDRVYVLYGGQVLEHGATAAVAAAPAQPYTFALHQASPLPDPRLQRDRRARTVRPKSEASQPNDGDGCPFAARCPHVVPRCRVERPTLRTSEHGAVACHRYPEWRTETAAAGACAESEWSARR